MIKRFLIKILFRLVDSSESGDYRGIDKKAVKNWLFSCAGNKGFDGYFKYEDLSILKAALNGQEERMYWMLVGRRFQLLSLRDEVRKVYQNAKSEDEKTMKQEGKDAR